MGENQKKETPAHTFEMYDVFAVDVIVSTGEGKGREEDARTTVFKKRDIVYQLKLKASRVFFSEMDKRFALMPFTLRAFEDEKKARMGVVECVKHGLCDPYPVIFEREGEIVAQFKFTVLMMPSGPLRITGGPAFDPEMYKSQENRRPANSRPFITTNQAHEKAKQEEKEGRRWRCRSTPFAGAPRS